MTSRWVRLVAMVAVAVAVIAIPLTVPGGPAWVIAYAVWVFLLYEAAVTCIGGRGVAVQRQIDAPQMRAGYRLTVGQTLSVTTHVRLSLWARFCVLRWHHRVVGSNNARLSGIRLPGFAGTMQVTEQLSGITRGPLILEDLVWSTSDLFGLQRIRGWTRGVDTILVHPAWHPVLDGDLPPLGSASDAGPAWALREPGYPTGIRAYREGDPYNRIHWAATAHRDRLMTREVWQLPKPSLLMALQTTDSAYPNSDAFEWAVSLCASLLQRAVQGGVRVVLDLQGVRYACGLGSRGEADDSLQIAMDALAQIRTSQSTPSFTAPSEATRPHDHTWIISPVWDLEFVNRVTSGSAVAGVQWWVVHHDALPHDTTSHPVGRFQAVPREVGLWHAAPSEWKDGALEVYRIRR